MVTEKTKLPEGTDQIVPGASTTGNMTDTTGTTATTGSGTTTSQSEVVQPTAKDKAVAKIKEGQKKVATEAAGKARGMVGDGLVKSSEAVGNIAKLVSDTASGLDENLGAEYGDYARKAASYLDDTSRKLATKDPDELIDDTREFVRKSPGVALAGAAIVGFAIARLIQSGLDAEKTSDR
ncbi:hypothetical protein [Sphingomicrobium lutaoense]|uniref:ElaB/YqjD/DUF883 family membrane-anchored ribosome-binding protein n=1 Tax=Sphingomicrobium lutaoense TaxID=515949 RepID=A0A839YX11_9SPHN|nr:hypothetical protein [Sphingomicrobium lutaoense]MBB3763729.1 ElaB/YqjD/DUF883 family membrane-anchored ribosome-binding protein [Sphingomicrobium lutaoense]